MLKRWAWLLVGLSVTVAFSLAGYRVWLNRQNRTVDLVLDGRSYQELAREMRMGYADLLALMKRSGATAVAVPEEDLASMQQAGLLRAYTGAKLREALALGTVSLSGVRITDGYTYVLTDRPAVMDRIGGRLAADLVGNPAPGVLELRLAQDLVSQLTFGFDAADFEAVHSAGLRPVPRPANASPALVAKTFAELDKLAPEARSVIFRGREVLGYPAAVNVTADAVKARGWVVGLVEQPTGQGYLVLSGQESLAEQIGYRVARVSLEPDGVWMRGAGMIYLRGRPQAEVAALADRLRADGYTLGLPSGLSYVRVGRAATVVLSLALAGVLILLSGGHWLVAVAAILAAVAGPYLAPGAAGWAQAGALGLIPALGLQAGPGGLPNDPESGLAAAWRLARYVGSGVAWLGVMLFAAVAGALVATALRGAPADLLGMTPPPSVPLSVGVAVLAFAGLHRSSVHWNDAVSRMQLGALAVVLLLLGAAILAPSAAPALVGLSALGGLSSGPWRKAGLALGFAGAVALAMAPVSGAPAALTGAGMGLALYAYHTYRGSAGRMAGRGRETA